jgi:ribosomal protein S18 acetylase RimI-like enzyme
VNQSQPQPQNCGKPLNLSDNCLVSPPGSDRNTVRHADGWCLTQFHDLPVEGFDCGDGDLNEYFLKDAIEARAQMTCETFALHHDDAPDVVLGLVSVCNDVVAVKNLRGFVQFRTTPEGKLKYKEWPAVKIARLAIKREIQSKDIGTHLVNLLKTLFVFQNRTGCRVMTVDAYNKPRVLNFYDKNGFQFLTEKDKAKHTRSMWFDLLTWKNAQSLDSSA